ncbi:MAG: MFS transporter [Anaerolineae bacterium]|jgi:FSR family fosmidomycin resistance protein-like MFS transporter|nr:MFS transporter [Chloroflexota bacterium]
MEQSARNTLIGEALAHALHDTWYGVAPILLASVSGQLGLANADIGLMLLVYQAVSSVTQPSFGRLSERYGGRTFAVGAIIWTALMFTGALFAQSKLLLTLLIGLAGLGSGAFHPQGTANSTLAGGARLGATATSLFFFGGTLGTALLGSAVGGLLIAQWGRQSLILIAVLNITLALVFVRRLVPEHLPVQARARANDPRPKTIALNGVWFVLAMLLGAIALRAFGQQAVVTYVPKLQADLGVSPAVYGLVMSLFLAAVAVGGVVGAYLADKVGTRLILVLTLLLTAGSLWLFTVTLGVASYVALLATGFFIGPSHTLLLVSGQRRFPERMAMVSGIFLGFSFVSGAVLTWLFGLLADARGLQGTLVWLPAVVLVNALLALIATAPSGDARPSARTAGAAVER